MKKVLSLILATFSISVIYTYADNYTSRECKIPILLSVDNHSTGIDRTLSRHIDAYHNLDSNTIEVEFYGLDDGEIYIIDSWGNCFYNQIIYSGIGIVTLPAPVQSDIYTLIIRTDTFYGEGKFIIE